MVKYRIFSSEVYSQYIGMYTGYGIEAILPDGTNAGRIEDISEDRAYVELIKDRLNNGAAEAVHLNEIVEDMLN